MNDKPSSRRSGARRQKERRENPFAFNSAEWIAVMKDQYLLWPKRERRMAERRAADRREALRIGRPLRSSHWLREENSVSLLNDEEKQMIQALFNEDE